MTDPDEIYRRYPFARPSFVEGVGRIFDLANSLNTSDVAPDGAEADAQALEQDWQAIGRDFQMVLGPLRQAPSRPSPASSGRQPRKRHSHASSRQRGGQK
jgi:hypothetical protein